MTGPTLINHSTKDWPAYIKANGVAKNTWYCAIPGVMPCGFSTQDGVSGESSGDRVEMDDQFWAPAKRAYMALVNKTMPSPFKLMAFLRFLFVDLVALWNYAHEFFHCYVRLGEDGKPLEGDLETYSHPGDMKGGIRHAIRRQFPINAFTRLLRWRAVPADAWADFLKWFGEQVDLRADSQ